MTKSLVRAVSMLALLAVSVSLPLLAMAGDAANEPRPATPPKFDSPNPLGEDLTEGLGDGDPEAIRGPWGVYHFHLMPKIATVPTTDGDEKRVLSQWRKFVPQSLPIEDGMIVYQADMKSAAPPATLAPTASAGRNRWVTRRRTRLRPHFRLRKD